MKREYVPHLAIDQQISIDDAPEDLSLSPPTFKEIHCCMGEGKRDPSCIKLKVRDALVPQAVGGKKA